MKGGREAEEASQEPAGSLIEQRDSQLFAVPRKGKETNKIGTSWLISKPSFGGLLS